MYQWLYESFIWEIIQTIDVQACVLSLSRREDYYRMSSEVVKRTIGLIGKALTLFFKKMLDESVLRTFENVQNIKQNVNLISQ